MTYDLDVVYVVSLGLFVGLIVIPIRDYATKRGWSPASFLWGWLAIVFSMVLVIPVLITKGADVNWRLLMAAYTEGLPVGAVAIVAYDLLFKPARRFGKLLVRAIAKWVMSSMDKGGVCGEYGASDSLGEEELENMPGNRADSGLGDSGGTE